MRTLVLHAVLAEALPMSQAKDSLLDHRYSITGIVRTTPGERWYAARHVELDSPVRIIALHAASTAPAPRSATRSTFWSLAGLASALRHPLLSHVRDCFVHGQEYFVVTDPLPAETLAARVARAGPLPLREALAVGLQLCDALSYVQRTAPALLPFATIAPANVFVRADGRAVLADLGVCHWPYKTAPSSDARPSDGALATSVASATCDAARADLRDVAAVLLFALTARTVELLDSGMWQPSLPGLDLPSAVAEVIAQGLEAGRADAHWTPEAFGGELAQAARRTLPAAGSLPPRTDTVVRLATGFYGTALESPSPLQAATATASRAEVSLRRTGERARAALATALHWIG